MTDLFCTNCGNEFRLDDDVVAVCSAYVESAVPGLVIIGSDSPYIHTLCKTCAKGLVIRTKATILKSYTDAPAQEPADFCSTCGAVIGHLPGCPDGMASVNLKA